MALTGKNYIGFQTNFSNTDFYQATDPATGEALPERFSWADTKDINEAVKLATTAFQTVKNIEPYKRAVFLDAIAAEIICAGHALIQRCMQETGLPEARILNERARTCGQLQMFAELLREGWWVDARIDTANKNRQPPKPDIRRMLLPLGPVVVFGASNFPLAFSVAGGDTASALAAGCPVIVKAHPSHPGTGEMVANAIIEAAKKTNMPSGILSYLHLKNEAAIRLVQHPQIRAIGFTGSRKAGLAILQAAMQRNIPIPVYAEMSSVNPVVLLENALQNNGSSIATGLAQSVTLGAGQFCTNPGLVFFIKSESAEKFIQLLPDNFNQISPATMLNNNICNAYYQGLERLSKNEDVRLLSAPKTRENNTATPAVFMTTAKIFSQQKTLSEEIFGPATLLVQCDNEEQLLQIVSSLEGQLTLSIHAATGDEKLAKTVMDIAAQKAGRIIYNGFPTGVEVCHAMQHGGPFPSTTDARSTSVGTAAIQRFVRPVAFQDFPDILLPAALQNNNPLKIMRLVNGNWTKDEICL